ncbi:SCO family protein [Leptospira sp. 96542]|nr:SCO family protein [Leptospira sp. 96542]
MRFKFVFLFFIGIHCNQGVELTELPIGGNIVGIDKNRNSVDLKKIEEPVVLVFFGYTYCPDFCPNTLMKIKSAVDDLSPSDRKKFKVVFVSVDPIRDAPETVQKYVSFYLPESIGLSFTQSETDRIVKQYAAYVAKTEDGSSFDHSTYIYVLDSDRKTRKLIKTTDTKDMIKETILALGGNSVQTK